MYPVIFQIYTAADELFSKFQNINTIHSLPLSYFL